MSTNPIRTRRKQLGLTQRQLALKAGTTQTSIAHWETGKKAPSLGVLPALSKALACPLADLLPISTTPNPSRLTLARINKRMTIEQVAEQLGVAASTVVRWEQGVMAPSADLRDAYIRLLGIPKKWVQPSRLPGPAPSRACLPP